MTADASAPRDPIDVAIAAAEQRRRDTGEFTDMERILRLPVRERSPAEDARIAWEWTLRLRKHPDAPPLRPIQGLAVHDAALATIEGSLRGVLIPAGVGHGKTLIALLLQDVMLAERAIMFVPPPMREQLALDVLHWKQHYNFTVPRIMAYSDLSSATATSFLDYYRPDLIIADEAHCLRHSTAARTKRVMRYFKEHPTTRLCLLSGTLTSTSVFDFAHLAELCLRDLNPLPLHRKTLEQWASVMDPDGAADHQSWQAVWPMVRALVKMPSGEAPPASPFDVSDNVTPQDRADGIVSSARQTLVRRAFHERMRLTPGIVTTREPSVGSNLFLIARCPNVPRVIADALQHMEDTWSMPDVSEVGADGVRRSVRDDAVEGEDIADAMTLASAASQLSAGFVYVWDWTFGGRWPAGKTDDDKEWLARRSQWHKAVRTILRYHSRAGLDSPMLVAQWVIQGHGGPEIRQAYHDWCEDSEQVGPDGQAVPYKDRERPPTKTIWLDKFLVEDVARVVQEVKMGGGRWGQSGACLLWYSSLAIETALRALGLPVYGAGSPSVDFAQHPIAAVSIAVHGGGKNYQKWAHNVVIEPPASGATWEQMLGRTHRQGQLADDVYAEVYQHTERFQRSMARAIERSRYIEDTQGQRQKLILARWVHKDGTPAKPPVLP